MQPDNKVVCTLPFRAGHVEGAAGVVFRILLMPEIGVAGRSTRPRDISVLHHGYPLKKRC